MKFAFSTISCPKWDFETIVTRAKEYGYDGVEIRGFLNESILTAANVFLSDPAKVKYQFASGGISICCLASSIAMTGSKKRDRILAEDLKKCIETAEQLGCGLVKIFDRNVGAGQSRASAGAAMGDWLVPLADYAAARGVNLVIENALSFRSAKEMWSILDRLSHPAIGVCWDIFNATLIGESPLVSVPVLNSRIQYTQVKDAKLGALGATYCKIGEGDVPIKNFVTRLRGIGYTGWMTVEWEKAWLPNLAEPEEILPDAVKKLKEWEKLGTEEPPAKSKEPAKAH